MIKYFLAGLATMAGLAHAAPPLKDFFEPEMIKDAALSPSGRYLALRIGSSGQRDSMLVLDSETSAEVGNTRLDGYDIGDIRWVNDNRLVFNVADHITAPGDINFAPGMYAVNRDGKNVRQLVDHTGNHRLEKWNTFLMHELGAQDSEFIYARRPSRERNSPAIKYVNLVRLDTSTGRATLVPHPTAPRSWMLDHKGQPSIMMSEKDGKETLYYQGPSGEWRELASFPAYGNDERRLIPVGFMDDQHLLVKTRRDGDKAALYSMNLASSKIDPEPLVSLSDFDFNGSMVYSNKRLLGLHYLGDARSSAWFDPGMKTAQTEIDKQMRGLVNVITPPLAPEAPWLLVESYSDRQPRIFSLFNIKTGKLKVIGLSHPNIKPAEMGKQDLVKFKARDGLLIPSWLTLPAKGGKTLPLIVVIHGGPYLRGAEWGWSPESQFLASRGYAVLEPEFRGSTGYGYQLFKAGMKQWGLAMQDDIADSVKWAVAQGYADPARVCLLGGSYGGYAALMGLIKDPELYRCGVAYAAVTDIPLLLDNGSNWQSDMSDEYRKFGAPVLLGDVEADAERFTATSPLKQAARIKRPLLLAHGSDDGRVPLPHFIKMRSALQDNKADVEYIEYIGEGHGWSTTEHRLDFWSRVEKFLDKHIGAGATSPSRTAAPSVQSGATQ